MEGDAERAPVRPTVLVVDDVPYLRELASLFLARSARVLTAGDGAEALELAHSDRPDLIVSDIRMPALDGVELCGALAREPSLAKIPFIMLVSDTTGVERGRAIRAGADDVLSKPLSRLALLESVGRLLSESPGRGQPRVATDVPVAVTTDAAVDDARSRITDKAVVRNLSRGGVFLETQCELATHAEVRLHFRLPGSKELLMPSAQVVWGRRAQRDAHAIGEAAQGFGLRFLELDDAASRIVDDFVFERTSRDGRSGNGTSDGTDTRESLGAVG